MFFYTRLVGISENENEIFFLNYLMIFIIW